MLRQIIRPNLIFVFSMLLAQTEPELTKIREGKLHLNLYGSGANDNLQIDYDPDKFTVTFEAIPITDERLQASWDSQIYRILLTAKNRLIRDEFAIQFRQQSVHPSKMKGL